MILSLGSAEIASVTLAANVSRSTARACPAGTLVPLAMRNSSESTRRISSFSSQGAVFSLSDLSEFEQTSSANLSVWCAGVDFTGRISYNSTSRPRCAHCQAASQPARQATLILLLVVTSYCSWVRLRFQKYQKKQGVPAQDRAAAWFPIHLIAPLPAIHKTSMQ